MFYAKSQVDPKWTSKPFHWRFKVLHVLASTKFSNVFSKILSWTSCSKSVIWYFLKYTSHIPIFETLLLCLPPSGMTSLSLVHNPTLSSIRLKYFLDMIFWGARQRSKICLFGLKWKVKGREGIIKFNRDYIIIGRCRKHLVCRISTLSLLIEYIHKWEEIMDSKLYDYE